MRYDLAADLVFNEYAASIEKHGDWSAYSVEQMLSVIIHELMVEAGDAEKAGDITGQHGVIRELAQVSACCHKAIIVLTKRASMTLADEGQPAGLHMQGVGAPLPASPSLHQGKESMTNHPEGVGQI